MKKTLALLLSASLLLSLFGCSGKAAEIPAEEVPLSSQIPDPDDAADVPAEPSEEEPEDEPYVRSVDPAGPMVALTFDDGPHPVNSNHILDILEENHAVATFFEVGANVSECPEALERMVELGCEIGSHSYAHHSLTKLDGDALAWDLAAADQAIYDACGVTPTLLRPPYGAVNEDLYTATGHSLVTWSVDTEDWKAQDAQTVIDYIQGLTWLDGQVVLLHSTHETTAQAMETVIPWLIDQGYQLVTVSELLAYYYGETPQPDSLYGYTFFAATPRTDTPAELPSA